MATKLTEAEVRVLTCDCLLGPDEHHETCGTTGEYDVLLSSAVLTERVEQIIDKRLAADRAWRGGGVGSDG